MTSRPAPTPVPAADPATEPGRARRWVTQALAPFWVVPALWCVAAIVLGVLIPRLDDGIASFLPFLFQGGADGARTVLSSIASAMISVTGLVFSITIVVLQLASSQFSPRVLRTFLESRITQHTLGVFAASFLYSLTVLRSVVDLPGHAVPQLGVTIAYVLVLAAVGMFLAFIHHITQSISVATVVRRTADETRDLLERSRDGTGAGADAAVAAPPAGQVVAVATRSGYVDTLDHRLLCDLATRHGTRIELTRTLGSFVVEGAPIALVHGVAAGDTSVPWDREIARGVEVSRERSMRQDLSFGFRRLVDIAERALSPGTNDPTTAVQVLDQLHDLLRRMALSPDRLGIRLDPDGRARLVTSEWTFADYLDLALDEIAHYGRDSLQVPRRLEELLLDLEAAATPAHRDTVAVKAAQLRSIS